VCSISDDAPKVYAGCFLALNGGRFNLRGKLDADEKSFEMDREWGVGWAN
jgi:hypothetical protein